MSPPERSARLAVDIGGTFTDVVLQLPDGRQRTIKLLTTYDHPGNAVLAGIRQVVEAAALQPGDIGLIIHGTTLATNALIERRGATTALLTTRGHRDALEMAHEDRFEQYDINIDRPKPLVPRYLRLPITERMDRDGNVLIPLDEDSVLATLETLDRHKVTSVAVGYLHGYVNPAHELRTAALISAARPDLSLSLASEVAPEIREFERLSTACANAYVRPVMATYLERLATELKAEGYHCPFLLMTSGGGLTTLETAARFPIRLVESGPAGGAILARHLARQLGMNRTLSFDMGGTTAKLCLIDDGEPLTSRSFEVDRAYRFKKGSGLPVRIPVIEMVEIGAGGGSIAAIDRLQRISVGPESAGSEPGPAAYGRGGKSPTVTDADVVMGKLYAEKFAGGALNLDTRAANLAIGEIASMLSSDNSLAAYGISEVVDENMAAAARAHAAEFGLDVSSRDIIAFGGAAPLHASRLGEKLGVRRIIIPANAGVGSAVGFLLAPVAFEVVRSRHQLLAELNTPLINSIFAEMSAEASAVVSQGHTDTDDLAEIRQAYMRYIGQGHEIAVTLPVDDYDDSHPSLFRNAFEAAYRRLYGHVIDGVDIEILSWTLTISAPVPTDSAPPADSRPGPASEPVPVATQRLFDPATASAMTAGVFWRDDLRPGQVINGPALIAENQTTTLVSSAYCASIDPAGHLTLERIHE
ncbi:MAG: hydantoinase/oxoprolinase family protein [Proteobacteria bacterium]|nr:hydantoinase/oxoprolinase family protein [Pseudomonadota bacterium]